MKKIKLFKTLLFTILLVIGLIISLNINRTYTAAERNIKSQLTAITKLFSNLIYSKTADQTDSYLIQKNLNISLEQEINELKEVLNLNKTKSEYDKINATVISRNNQYWFNTIIIDKGSKDNIKKDMAVITKNGLIGKISKVDKTTSQVKLLSSSDIKYKTSVAIRVNKKDYFAITNGYDQKKQLLKVIAVDKNIAIKKGDIITTSGLGNIPRGIYIGKVESYEIDNYDLSKIVYVKTEQNFNNINYVTILKVKND